MSESLLTIQQALKLASRLQAVSDTAELDLQLLLAAALDKPRSYLYTWPERALTAPQQARLERTLARRQQGEPVAHILGWQGFWDLDLEVNASTLIPRPETELLVELALAQLPADRCRVADLGTGTGAIALALARERPAWELVAVECVAAAAALAERNRARLQLDNVRVLEGSWYQPLQGPFDLIVSNPPYIDPDDPHLSEGDVRFEPLSALVAPHQGLADIAQIIAGAQNHLASRGWLMLEHGYDQGAAVRDLMRQAGMQAVATRQDLGGRDRVTLAQRSPIDE
ncbi:peptide chain release factor N(5)-glutamine methyltransferase [Motiliproteus sediminis]|uniref:peptide chain release factor N(5)-glutamine methyltransferase n=1 Tax=Motiliproteus sediminis TaxID=1468178 RepID=UPI001AF00D14|nr:peptide chain release factor N(5)-glutamine methyltransferase [Motiliproteus sediminis]